MIIMHATDPTNLPRLVAQSLAERLRVMPAVVVTGARQTGKSTLAQELAPGKRRYFSLDDLDVADAARPVPAHRFCQPAADAPGLRVAGRPRELSRTLAHDAPRASGTRTLRPVGGPARRSR